MTQQNQDPVCYSDQCERLYQNSQELQAMPDFTETMRLKEQAEEDIYFAKLDRELIAALHKETLDTLSTVEAKKAKKLTRSYEKDLNRLAKAHRKDHEQLSHRYWKKLRKLLSGDQDNASG